jgi:lysophospholipase L1-like esterase
MRAAKLMNMWHSRIIKVGLPFLLMTAFGCAKQGVSLAVGPVVDTAIHKDSTALSDTNGGKQTYLALGDSYTIGQSVPSQDSYPAQAVALLGDSVNAPEIIATTGWTTEDLLNDLQGYPPKRAVYSRVTLLIGVNNQFQHLPLSQYQTQFTQLLQKAVLWAGDTLSHVTVLSIPDYGDSFYGQSQPNPAAISAAIDTFNMANLQISQQFGVQYLNITDLTRAAKGDSTLFASDGLHYSGKEMALWAARLVKLW